MTPLFWKYLIVSEKRKKFVSMWVEIASRMDELPVQFSFKEQRGVKVKTSLKYLV